MSAGLSIDEATIRRHASADSFARGRHYARDGAVSEIVQRGRALHALVVGSQDQPYRVQITVDDAGDVEARCTCPYAYGDWCKHIVATLLVARGAPEQVSVRPAPEALLAGLDRDQLQALLLQLIQREPDLIDSIELEVARARPPVGAATAPAAPLPPAPTPPPVRRPPVDTELVRRQMRAMFRASGAHQYGYAHTVVSQVGEHLKAADEYSQAGDAANALRLLEAVTAEYTRRWFEVDDSSGNLGELFTTIGACWARALLCAELPPDERDDWAARLAGWEAEAADYGLEAPFELARAAAAEGWDDPDLRRKLRGEVAERGTPVDGLFAYQERLSTIRLDILARQGRWQEYLNLALAEGELDRYVVMLARVGRTAEAVREGLAVLRTAPEALALARVLREQGQVDEAVQIARHGLTLAEPRGTLASWLADLAASLGRQELALAAAEAALRSEPSLAAYLKIAELAGDGWPARRPAVLDFLRRASHHWNATTASVDVFLHEGLIDDAINAVKDGTYQALLQRVVEAAKTERPEWVLATAKEQAERIMEAARASHYDQVVVWLYHVQDAYRTLGRPAEWEAYLASVRAQHGRKYKLMGFIDRM